MSWVPCSTLPVAAATAVPDMDDRMSRRMEVSCEEVQFVLLSPEIFLPMRYRTIQPS